MDVWWDCFPLNSLLPLFCALTSMFSSASLEYMQFGLESAQGGVLSGDELDILDVLYNGIWGGKLYSDVVGNGLYNDLLGDVLNCNVLDDVLYGDVPKDLLYSNVLGDVLYDVLFDILCNDALGDI